MATVHPRGAYCRNWCGRVPEQLPHAPDHLLRLERLHQHRGEAGLRGSIFINRLKRPGQEHDRNMSQVEVATS